MLGIYIAIHKMFFLKRVIFSVCNKQVHWKTKIHDTIQYKHHKHVLIMTKNATHYYSEHVAYTQADFKIYNCNNGNICGINTRS